MKLIPFDRHFTAGEQDLGLKKLFRRNVNKSAILNWLVDGYRLVLEVGLTTPPLPYLGLVVRVALVVRQSGRRCKNMGISRHDVSRFKDFRPSENPMIKGFLP